MIHALLIANRGEIAVRISRTARQLGIRSVAVYSDADAQAQHVALADMAVRLGPAPAGDSYLVIDKLIAAAQRAGVDAIHPGYGFLAENAAFAQACLDAGLIFIGPPPAVIAALGDKRAARRLAQAAGVPVVPGYDAADQTDAALTAAAQTLGLPVLVKAAAGGGGKGIRRVDRMADLPDALATARREARQAFGDDALLLEKVIAPARHIEIQIFGDQHGNLIHLGERECSLQRRRQKLIEETPAPAFTPAQRQQLTAAALAVARAVNYVNAGTVEFLLGPDGQFYFLEINTRIQVEHPVTEAVTGFDLVAWQIQVAEGQPLPLTQTEIQPRGHAIEARLYAENPAQGFLPTAGRIQRWQPPAAAGVRVDSALAAGDEVSLYYDALLAKIIAYGPDRPSALRRLRRALEETVLLGVTHNLSFLQDVIQQLEVAAGAPLDVTFIERQWPAWTPPSGDVALACITAALAQWQAAPGGKAHHEGFWRNNPNAPTLYTFQHGQRPLTVALWPVRDHPNQFKLEVDGAPHAVEMTAGRDGEMILTVDGWRRRVVWAVEGGSAEAPLWWCHTPAGVVQLVGRSRLPRPRPHADSGGALRAPMPGVVLAVLVAVGQMVEPGDPLLKLEAMKMEHTIRSAAPGVVEAIYYQAGDKVDADAQLLAIRDLAS